MTGFLRKTIRYFLYIGVCLFGITYELVKSETIRWLLIAGYLVIIGASLYAMQMRAQQDAEDDATD